MGLKADESTGLLNHYIGKVESSFAGTDAQYMDGNVVRITWETSVVDVLQEDYDGVVPDSIMRNITLGDGWDVDPDTGILYHEDDEVRQAKGLEPKSFKISSFYGNLIALCAGQAKDWNGKYEVTDGGDEFEVDLAGVGKYLEKKYGDLDNVPERDPSIWEGFVFEFRGLRFITRNSEFNRVVPVRLVDVPTGPVTTETVPASVKPDYVDFDFTDYGATDAQHSELLMILNEAKNQTEFVKRAIAVNGVKENDALMAVLVADDGPWSQR